MGESESSLVTISETLKRQDHTKWISLHLGIVVDFSVSVLKLLWMEENFRTKELKTSICHCTVGMMPPASISKTARTVFIRGNILIGDVVLVAGYYFFPPVVYYYVYIFIDVSYMVWERLNRASYYISETCTSGLSPNGHFYSWHMLYVGRKIKFSLQSCWSKHYMSPPSKKDY